MNKWHSGPPPHVGTERLRNLFSYCPDSGILRWANPKSKRIPSGSIVGTAHPAGYLRVMVNGKNLYVHRIIWAICNNEWPEQIDHLNGIRDDNRLCNLRAATPVQNCHNITRPRSTNTGERNIYFDRRYGTYRVSLRHNGRPTYKTFKTLACAIEFRDQTKSLILESVWPANARVPRIDPRKA